jgi:hypothetical protein
LTPRTTVKKEPASTPPTKDALVIREGARGRKRKPRKEDTTAATASDLAAVEAARAEDAALCEARPRRQRPANGRGARLVQAELGEGRGRAAAAAAGPGGRTTPRRRRTTRRTRQRSAAHQAGGLQRGRLVPVDAATPRQRWTGVQPLGPGQSSQQAPPPQDDSDSSDDGDGDYTAFYRHLGM